IMVGDQKFHQYNPQCSVPIGGFSLWEASAEVRFDISGPFGAAVFCDTGGVSPNVLDLDFETLRLSCGGGVRYDTPVGPIRLDVGYRIAPLQNLGFPDENAAHAANPTIGIASRPFGAPIGINFGIGEAF
ncbi:MAG TPA: BamA/TamA family outer membrane protein, partial [Polyangiaceae bacterium]|nr:BamA/TamA family outer membrane protein [Polyangiaceae bacterium]